jgi:uncharacterized protein (DUF2147 family)
MFSNICSVSNSIYLLKTFFYVKKLFFASLILLLAASTQAQTLTGTWRTIDDETNESKSHIEIYQSGDKYFGKIAKLLTSSADKTCDKCPDARKNQKLMGMVLVENLSLEKGLLSGGKILDPEKGKWYTCKMWLKEGDPNTMVVRGYLYGFYRTQYWYRVQ